MTVVTTVGFGDITPVGQAARAIVTVQMIFDLLFLGVAVRILGTSLAAAPGGSAPDTLTRGAVALPCPGARGSPAAMLPRLMPRVRVLLR